MGRVRRDISAYQGMWLFVMFDLPVDDAQARNNYTRFRKSLLANGFTMIQFSIYARYFHCEEACQPHQRKIKTMVPSKGQVRILMVTDRQFGKMVVYQGKIPQKPENPPAQLQFF